MRPSERVEVGLRAAVTGSDAGGAADRLCEACVELLDVDGAALSVWLDGDARGTFGTSGASSHRLDDLQFTFAEGPCVDAVRTGRQVLVDDLAHEDERWPAFTRAAMGAGIASVFALPVSITVLPFGALDLFRFRPGGLSPDELAGGVRAAELAAVPLLGVICAAAEEIHGEATDPSPHLVALERGEVHQAIGMIMGQLELEPDDALARLRAYAYVTGSTAKDVAEQIVGRRLVLDEPDGR